MEACATPTTRWAVKVLSYFKTTGENASMFKRAKLGTGAAAALNIKDVQRMMEPVPPCCRCARVLCARRRTEHE